MSLESLSGGYRAAIFGASGGIGAAFVSALSVDPRCAAVYAGARAPSRTDSPKLRPFQFDLEDESSIERAAAELSKDGPLDLILVTTGILHEASLRPEKTWRSLSPAAFNRAFSVNAIGPALIAKHLLGHLSMRDKAVFAALSARVGSIADNRLGGWHAYRASKAALNMLIRTLSIELAVRNKSAVCVALHPGTVDTGLSLPFQAGVAPASLFTAAQSVRHLLNVIDRLGPAQSGGLFAWDGAEIPF
jgi:NAD(P)-dependent dehydrogenase (short-subunit alcohol dehydrogenase family)